MPGMERDPSATPGRGLHRTVIRRASRGLQGFISAALRDIVQFRAAGQRVWPMDDGDPVTKARTSGHDDNGDARAPTARSAPQGPRSAGGQRNRPGTNGIEVAGRRIATGGRFGGSDRRSRVSNRRSRAAQISSAFGLTTPDSSRNVHSPPLSRRAGDGLRRGKVAKRRQCAPSSNRGKVDGHYVSPFGKYRSGYTENLLWQS